MPVRKILTVDDARTVRLLVKKALQPFAVEVVEAPDGEMGLNVAFKERPDLILLDVTMPVLDGVAMLTRLRKDPVLRSIPVMMLTAEAGRELVLKLAQLGARDYVVKPFDNDTLAAKIDRIVPLVRTADLEQNRKVLVLLEDKPAVVKQITEGVQDPDWEWQPVTTSAEALAIADQRRVAAVVVCLSLPDDAAFKLQTEMQSRPQGADAAFLGLALKTSPELHERAKAAGFAAVADKPIDPAQLGAQLRDALNKDSANAGVRLSEEHLTIAVQEGTSDARNVATLEAIGRLAPQAVESGCRTAVFDLTALSVLTAGTVKMVAQGMARCEQVGLATALLGPASLTESARAFPEAKDWQFRDRLEPAPV